MPATSARLLQSVQLALLFLANIAHMLSSYLKECPWFWIANLYLKPLPFTHLTVGLVKRAVHDGFTLHSSSLDWVALSDFYTAGPDAEDSYDEHLDPEYCYQSKGAYPVQLIEDFSFHTAPQYQFLACTDAKTEDVLHNQLRNVDTNSPSDFVVLTLRGNDIEFGAIIRACLVKPAGPGFINCDQTIADFYRRMNSCVLQNDMFRAYDEIFARMPADYHYQLYHLLYSKFFNDETWWCNDQTFEIFSEYRPPLTRALCQRLNRLAENFNDRLKDIAERYLESKWPSGQPHASGWVYNRIFTVNSEKYYNGHSYGLFDGHRFCEPNVQDPYFNDASIWFFGLNTDDASWKVDAFHFSNINAQSCQKDSKYEGNLTFSYLCDYARYFASPEAHKDITVPLTEGIVKSFHSRTVGHSAVKWYLSNTLIQFCLSEFDLCISPPLWQKVLSCSVKVTVGRETPTPKKQCFIAQTSLKLTSSSKGALPPPTSNPTLLSLYAIGTCHVHVKEYQDCSDDSKNLYAIVSMKDNARHNIGHTVVDSFKNPFRNPINNRNPYTFTSKLCDPLMIKKEHKNDYVQFILRSKKWNSKTLFDSPYCHTKGWNLKGGPNCMSQAWEPAVSFSHFTSCVTEFCFSAVADVWPLQCRWGKWSAHSHASLQHEMTEEYHLTGRSEEKVISVCEVNQHCKFEVSCVFGPLVSLKFEMRIVATSSVPFGLYV